MGFKQIWHIGKDKSIVLFELRESVIDLRKLLPENVKIPDFASEKRIKEWLGSRIIANKFFNVHEIQYDRKKPFLTNNPGSKISISHSKQIISLAYNKSAYLGLDVQFIDKKMLKILRKFCNEHEQSYIAGSVEKATLIWAAKEALYKLSYIEIKDYKNDLQINSISENTILAKIKEFSVELDYRRYSNYYICLASSKTKIHP